MLPKRVRVQLVAFLVLCGGVAANVFLFQGGGRPGQTPYDATAWNIAAIEAAEFDDTGSIGNQAVGAAPLNALDLAALAVEPPPQQGDTADVTRAVQRELQIRGYETGARDGISGTMTRAAILAFEYDNGLPLTARPSDELLKAIVMGTGSKPRPLPVKAQTAEARVVIANVQRSLGKIGYKAGPPSGTLTVETVRAIRTFEGDQALSETGRISGPLIARLGRLSGAGQVAVAPKR